MGQILLLTADPQSAVPVYAWAEQEGHAIIQTDCPGEYCGMLVRNALTDLSIITAREDNKDAIRLARGLSGDVLFGNLPRIVLARQLHRSTANQFLQTGVHNLLLEPCTQDRLHKELHKALQYTWRPGFFKSYVRVCGELKIYQDDYKTMLSALARRLQQLRDTLDPAAPGMVFGTGKPMLTEIRKEATKLGVPLIGQLIMELILSAPRKDPAGYALVFARLMAMAAIVQEHADAVPARNGWSADEDEIKAFRDRAQGAKASEGETTPKGSDKRPTGEKEATTFDVEEDGDHLYDEAVLPAFHSLALLSRMDTGDMDLSVSELAQFLQRDTTLCAQILSVANSSDVAPASPIDDLETAIHLIGLEQVKRLSASYRHTAKAHAKFEGFDWRLFWMHQVGCADLSQEIAGILHIDNGADLYAMGLLHDVGKVLLSRRFKNSYKKVVAQTLKGTGEICVAERNLLGLDHEEVGSRYAHRHGLPDVLRAAMAHHGNPEAAHPEFASKVAIVSVSNFICKKYQVGFSGSVVRAPNNLMEELPAWQWIQKNLNPMQTTEQMEAHLKKAAIQTRYMLSKAVKDMAPDVELKAG